MHAPATLASFYLLLGLVLLLGTGKIRTSCEFPRHCFSAIKFLQPYPIHPSLKAFGYVPPRVKRVTPSRAKSAEHRQLPEREVGTVETRGRGQGEQCAGCTEWKSPVEVFGTCTLSLDSLLPGRMVGI